MVLSHSHFHVHRLFFQANTVKGNRFFDDSGRILNKWADDYESVSNGLNGVVLSRPKEPSSLPNQMQVDSGRIWFTFIEPYTIETALPLIYPLVRDISDIIKVENYSRFGLRTEFFAPIERDSEDVRRIAAMGFGTPFHHDIEDVSGDFEFELRIHGSTRNLGKRVSARTVKVTRPPTTPGDYTSDGLIFDVDVYRDDSTELRDVRPFLVNAKETTEEIFGTTGRLLFGYEGDDDE